MVEHVLVSFRKYEEDRENTRERMLKVWLTKVGVSK